MTAPASRVRRARRALGPLAALAIAPPALQGCGEAAPPPEPLPISAAASSGPLRAEMSASAAELGVADRLDVELRWSADERGWSIDPPTGDAFEAAGWKISATTPIPEQLSGGRLLSGVKLTLEPFLPGKYTLGPIELDARNSDGVRRRVTLDPLEIEVASALEAGGGADDPPLGTLAQPPSTARADRPVWLVTAAAGGALALIAATVVVALRRRGRGTRTDPAALIDAAERSATVLGDYDACARSVRRAAGAIARADLASGSPDEIRRALEALDAERAERAAAAARALDHARFAPTAGPPDPVIVGSGLSALRELAAGSAPEGPSR